jgi:ATP-independent RNA helicase DbpA
MTQALAAPTPDAGPPFGPLPLPPHTLANLDRLGYLRMTPVQAACLPRALAGEDLPPAAARPPPSRWCCWRA